MPFTVEVRNPFDRAETAHIEMVVPPGWRADPPVQDIKLSARQVAETEFALRVPADAPPQERTRVAVDLTVGRTAFGQQAEALVSVR